MVMDMNKLKEIRKSFNLTQDEASKLLGISRKTYIKYELMDVEAEKIDYFIYKLKEKTKIDENHGVLSIDNIKSIVINILKDYNVKSCFLFGSYAKGYASDESDVDLLIDSDITGLSFYGLVERLREGLHKKVDLLTLNSLSNNPQMLTEIIRDGIKICG